MSTWKQKGRNDRYPAIIESWTYGETVPDWLSDISRVNGMSLEGNPILDLQRTNEGGYTIKSSDGESIVAHTKTLNDHICLGKNKDGHSYMFTLTPTQFDLLYGPV